VFNVGKNKIACCILTFICNVFNSFITKFSKILRNDQIIFCIIANYPDVIRQNKMHFLIQHNEISKTQICRFLPQKKFLFAGECYHSAIQDLLTRFRHWSQSKENHVLTKISFKRAGITWVYQVRSSYSRQNIRFKIILVNVVTDRIFFFFDSTAHNQPNVFKTIEVICRRYKLTDERYLR
jgi:hypothetical protein